MLFLLIALGLIALVWISILAGQHLRAPVHPEWADIRKKRDEALATLRSFLDEADQEKDSKEATFVAPPSRVERASELWELLLEGKTEEALALAESWVAEDPQDGDRRLLLSHALLESRNFSAASEQCAQAKSLGCEPDLLAYLEVRCELEEYLHSISPDGTHAKGTVLMPVEVLALELHLRLGEGNDASALWLPGHEGEVSKEEAREFVAMHFSGYYRLLETALKSVETTRFADGLYLLGRMALKCGFMEEGHQLLLPLQSEMESSMHRRAYQRDIALMRGEKPISSEDTSQGRKVIKLNVLN